MISAVLIMIAMFKIISVYDKNSADYDNYV